MVSRETVLPPATSCVDSHVPRCSWAADGDASPAVLGQRKRIVQKMPCAHRAPWPPYRTLVKSGTRPLSSSPVASFRRPSKRVSRLRDDTTPQRPLCNLNFSLLCLKAGQEMVPPLAGRLYPSSHMAPLARAAMSWDPAAHEPSGRVCKAWYSQRRMQSEMWERKKGGYDRLCLKFFFGAEKTC